MPDPMVILSRCLHVLGAITLFGGALFIRHILMPSASQLPEADQQTLKREVTRRWKIIVHVGITVLILTGFYNYLIVGLPQHKGDSQYHMWMGIKILLAMVVFFIASVLPGRAAAFEFMRRNPKRWLGVIIVCSTIIVAIAGALKVRGVPARPANAPVIANPAVQ